MLQLCNLKQSKGSQGEGHSKYNAICYFDKYFSSLGRQGFEGGMGGYTAAYKIGEEGGLQVNCIILLFKMYPTCHINVNYIFLHDG